ncbi:MAG: phage pi2 protein 07, partial [Colwellia sp.]
YILNDPKQNRKIVIEGFVFAPNKEKRDYLFELEAIIKTIKPVL